MRLWVLPWVLAKTKNISSSSGQLQPGCPGNKSEKNCDYLKIARTDLRLAGKIVVQAKNKRYCDRLLELLKVEFVNRLGNEKYCRGSRRKLKHSAADRTENEK